MIHVIVKEQSNQIRSLEISGHAGFAEHGRDLVCAGVSSIGVGLLNALVEFCEESCSYEMKDGFIKVEVLQNNDTNQLILKTGIIQLQTMELSYKNYIQIMKQEV